MDTDVLKMDRFDEIIINLLMKDSRISLKDLSKRLERNKSFIQYRLNNLLSKGIIEKIYPLVDLSKLDYLPFECYLKTQMSQEEEQDIINYLRKHKEIFFIERVIGNYSIRFLFFQKTLEESVRFIQSIRKSLISKVRKLDLKIITSIIRSNNSEEGSKSRFELFNSREDILLSKKEIEILREINKDPRSSIFNLSEKLGISRKFTKKTLSMFDKKEIITGFTADLNYAKLGFITRMFLINIRLLNAEDFNEFRNHLAESPYVQTITTYYPNQQISVEIAAKKLLDIRNFQIGLLNKYSNIIEKLDILEYYDEPKYSYLEDFLQELA